MRRVIVYPVIKTLVSQRIVRLDCIQTHIGYSVVYILYNQGDATYTVFLIIINVLRVSVGFSAHHAFLQSTDGVVDSRKAWQYPGLHIQFYKLLMMDGKTARNM
jgi:hypothetical protein